MFTILLSNKYTLNVSVKLKYMLCLNKINYNLKILKLCRKTTATAIYIVITC